MATATVADRINRAAASLDGVSSILNDMVDTADFDTARQVFALADLLDRINSDLSNVAAEIGKGRNHD